MQHKCHILLNNSMLACQKYSVYVGAFGRSGLAGYFVCCALGVRARRTCGFTCMLQEYGQVFEHVGNNVF